MTPKQRAALDGAEIRVFHLRYPEGTLHLPRPLHRWSDRHLACAHVLNERGQRVSPKGGTTRVVVEWPNGDSCTTEARCNPKDTYHKAVGREIALGRAIKLMEWARSGEPA